ncbi:hypothetical protein PCASD_22450 [Puccinia coronata f. sp. avenae]|uniref:Uncharacterized protein n=1 Tax=Puccinia coronata f. sp. avenae TaxID=200324 RepID=A0A2N5TSR0_9BASI|nr:hypothetical protein PCASD_22450 [Puccinia coronata f. sp. avenae]
MSEKKLKRLKEGCTTESYNVDSVTVSNFDLAEWVSFGVTPELRALITNQQLLRATPFTYSAFEQRVVEFYNGLTKRLTPRSRPTGSLASATTTPEPKEQTIWRIHTFLDSQGRCHFCKKTCGNAPGTCPEPCNHNYVKIPDSFQTPSKPANYKVPKPWTSASGGPGRATNPPAGRPNNRTAAIAAVKEENLFPDFDAASIAAIAAIDKELSLTGEEGCVSQTPKRIIVDLLCGDKHLRGLIDTGAKINLIRESTVDNLGASRTPLRHPTTIRLALDDSSTPRSSSRTTP